MVEANKNEQIEEKLENAENNTEESSPELKGTDDGDEKSPEKKLITAVCNNNLQEVMNVFAGNNNLNINCVDENGMSPLSHACFKGNSKMAQFLLDRGANVNQNDHEYRYTALMFAALGGHIDCVKILLDNGALIDMKNTVGRNAAQMAGFVGQHRPVAAINNHIRRELIDYYAKLNGVETEPKLPHHLCSTVHQIVQMVNIHPVRIFIHLNTNQCLQDDVSLKKVCNVLDLLSVRLFKSSEPQEMLSLKVHIISFILKYIHKQRQSASEPDNRWNAVIEKSIKFLLTPNESDFHENLERFLRDSIRNYKIAENTIFVQLVRSLTTVQIGDEPNCMAILQQTIGGKSDDGIVCSTCWEFDPKKRCSLCKSTNYCNESCQKYHWFIHKKQCKKSSSGTKI